MSDLHADAFHPASYDPDLDGPTASDLDVEAVSPEQQREGRDIDYYGYEDFDDDYDD